MLVLAALPAFADNAAPREQPGAVADFDTIERPRLAQGYRPALGLKQSQASGGLLGVESATAQMLVRLAQTSGVWEPMFYSVERMPSGLGLRESGQTTGVVLRGGERWSSSFEASTSADPLTSGRRTSLVGQLHAPLAGGVGISLGLGLSYLQAPGYQSGDTPHAGAYALSPGRSEASSPQLGYQLQLNYLYGERSTVALSYGARRDVEQYGISVDPVWFDSRQLSLSGEHWFSPSWALRYDIPASQSGSPIRGQGLRFGVHYRF